MADTPNQLQPRIALQKQNAFIDCKRVEQVASFAHLRNSRRYLSPGQQSATDNGGWLQGENETNGSHLRRFRTKLFEIELMV